MFNIHLFEGTPTTKLFCLTKYKYWNTNPLTDFILDNDVYILNHISRIPPFSASIDYKQLYKYPLTIDDISNKINYLENLKITNLDTLMNKRCIEIANKDKPIMLMCSGGIDSTAMLLAFIENKIPINVLMFEHALYEDDQFSKFLNKNNIKYKICNQDLFLNTLISNIDKYTVVTGAGGDQIAGCVTCMCNPKLINLNNPESMDAKEVIYYLHNEIPYWLDILINCTNRHTFIEIGWLMNFFLKWEWMLIRDTLYVNCVDKMFGSKRIWHTDDLFPFYGTDEFRAYGYNYFKKHDIITDGYKTKKFLKEYIYQRYSNKNYYINKIKAPSGYITFLLKFFAKINTHTNEIGIFLLNH